MKKYLARYNWFDEQYAVDIYANSKEEAMSRVKAIKETLVYDGELHSEIPVPPQL